MTISAVQDFLTKVGEDSALQGEMAKALEADNDREAVATLAQANGYEFTSEELWQEIQAQQAEFERRQAAGELTDEELEAVAGGGTPAAVVFGLKIASVVGTIASAGGSVGYGMVQAKW